MSTSYRPLFKDATGRLQLFGDEETLSWDFTSAIGNPMELLVSGSTYFTFDRNGALALESNITWNTDSGGDVGGQYDYRPDYINAATAVRVGAVSGGTDYGSMLTLNRLTLGHGDVDKYIDAEQGLANTPFMRYNAVNTRWEYSNDGLTTIAFDAGFGVGTWDAIYATDKELIIDTTSLLFTQTSTADVGFAITRNLTAASTDTGVLLVEQQHASDDQPALVLAQNAATSSALSIYEGLYSVDGLGGGTERFSFNAAGQFGIVTNSALAAAAISVEQTDADEAFLLATGTSAADASANVSTANAGTADMIRVEVDGGGGAATRWVPAYNSVTLPGTVSWDGIYLLDQVLDINGNTLQFDQSSTTSFGFHVSRSVGATSTKPLMLVEQQHAADTYPPLAIAQNNSAADVLQLYDGSYASGTMRFQFEPMGRLNIVGSASLTTEALRIELNDVTTPFMEFKGTAAAGTGNNISNDSAPSIEMLQIDVDTGSGAATRWLPAYVSPTIASTYTWDLIYAADKMLDIDGTVLQWKQTYTTGHAFEVYRDLAAASTDAAIVHIENQSSTDDQPALLLEGGIGAIAAGMDVLQIQTTSAGMSGGTEVLRSAKAILTQHASDVAGAVLCGYYSDAPAPATGSATTYGFHASSNLDRSLHAESLLSFNIGSTDPFVQFDGNRAAGTSGNINTDSSDGEMLRVTVDDGAGGFNTRWVPAYNNAVLLTIGTLDEAYDASAGAATVNVDAGDLTWILSSTYKFVVQQSGGIDYFSADNNTGSVAVVANGALGTLDLTGENTNVTANASSGVITLAANGVGAGAKVDVQAAAGGVSIATSSNGPITIAADTGGSSADVNLQASDNVTTNSDELLIDVNEATNGVRIGQSGAGNILDIRDGTAAGGTPRWVITKMGAVDETPANPTANFDAHTITMTSGGLDNETMRGLVVDLTSSASDVNFTIVNGLVLDYTDGGGNTIASALSIGANWDIGLVAQAPSVFAAAATFNDDIPLNFGDPDAALEWDTGQAQDALLLGLGASRSFILCDYADMSTDFGHAAATNPELVVHSASVTDVGDYVSLAYDGLTCGTMATDKVPTDFTIKGANAFGPTINLDGGNLILAGGDKAVGGADGIVQVGTTAPSHATLVNSDDLMVGGELEVDGNVNFDAGLTCYGALTSYGIHYYGGGGANFSKLNASASADQLLFAVGSEHGRHLVLGDAAYFLDDYDHAVQTNPTLFVHSAEDPDTDNGEFVGLAYNGLLAGTMETDRATYDFTIKGSNAYASAGVANDDGGNLILEGGDLAGAGIDGIVQVGSGFTTSHSLADANDLGVGGKLEVNGATYFDSHIYTAFNMVLGVGATGGNFKFLSTADTPDTFKMLLGSLSNSLVVCEYEDRDVDFAHAQQTNPTIFVQSADATTPAQYVSVAHDQTDGVIASGAGKLKLTPATTTELVSPANSTVLALTPGDPTSPTDLMTITATSGGLSTETLNALSISLTESAFDDTATLQGIYLDLTTAASTTPVNTAIRVDQGWQHAMYADSDPEDYGVSLYVCNAGSNDSYLFALSEGTVGGAATNRFIVGVNGTGDLTMDSATHGFDINQAYSSGGSLILGLNDTNASVVRLSVQQEGRTDIEANDAAAALRVGQQGAGTILELRDGGPSSGTIRMSVSEAGLATIVTKTDLGTEAVLIDQNDDDKAFIDYAGAAGASGSYDSTKNIQTWKGGSGAVDGPLGQSTTEAHYAFEGMVKTEVSGTEYWMPYYSYQAS